MNVISLKKYRELQGQMVGVQVYRAKIEKLAKVELLEELLRYHENFMRDPRDVETTLKGKALMEVLEGRAELTELKSLSADFKRKLTERLALQLAPASVK